MLVPGILCDTLKSFSSFEKFQSNVVLLNIYVLCFLNLDWDLNNSVGSTEQEALGWLAFQLI